MKRTLSIIAAILVVVLAALFWMEPEAPPPNNDAKLKQMANDLYMARVERRKLYEKYQTDSMKWAALDSQKDAEIAVLEQRVEAVPPLKTATGLELTQVIRKNWPELAAMTDTMFSMPLAAAREITYEALLSKEQARLIRAQELRIADLRAQRDSSQFTITRMNAAHERESVAADSLIQITTENAEHWEKEAKKSGKLVKWGKWVLVALVGALVVK